MARNQATETTATASAKGRQLQATVPLDVYNAFDEHHWEAKKETVDCVREALIDYGVKHGFLTVDEDGKASAVVKA